MAYSLLLLNGPIPGENIRLEDARKVEIGRHHSCAVQIDDDEVSRKHAEVSFQGGRWYVRDFGSTNGTQVNSRKVGRAVLERGDLIRIGKRLILFVDSQYKQSATRFRTSQWKATTMVGRSPQDGPWASLIQQGLNDPVSRVVRDSAVLCRVANELHQRHDTETLMRVVIEALVDGAGADTVFAWRIGIDGRLRCVGNRGSIPDDGEDQVLARLAVDRNKAIIFPVAEAMAKDLGIDPKDHAGNSICVPVNGSRTPLGAIECQRLPDQPAFVRSDLDFLVVVAHQVGLALENLESRERLERANQQLRARVDAQTRIVGSSPQTQELLDNLARVSGTDSTALILGESGTGKELIAQSIHQASNRADGPYIAVNCAAPSESLLESELFGHEAGAYTGAERRRIGQFERAHRGTIFLDEVGEMSLNCQAKLLRILEGHPFERVGGEQSIHVDVRIIAATHRHLEQLVREGKFREDLYYRLRVVDIRVPPLRERGEDAVELATMFLEQFRAQMGRGPMRLSRAARSAIQSYHWPGNIRQLKNAVERAVVLGQDDELDPADLGIHASPQDAQPATMVPLKEAERRHISYVLQQVKGNKTAACRVLDISRATLYSKLQGFAAADQ